MSLQDNHDSKEQGYRAANVSLHSFIPTGIAVK